MKGNVWLLSNAITTRIWIIKRCARFFLRAKPLSVQITGHIQGKYERMHTNMPSRMHMRTHTYCACFILNSLQLFFRRCERGSCCGRLVDCGAVLHAHTRERCTQLLILPALNLRVEAENIMATVNSKHRGSSEYRRDSGHLNSGNRVGAVNTVGTEDTLETGGTVRACMGAVNTVGSATMQCTWTLMLAVLTLQEVVVHR